MLTVAESDRSGMTSSRSLISKWLIESRAIAGLTRLEAASAIGISAKQLERLELGHHQPKAEYILTLARLYKVAAPGTAGGDNTVPRGTSSEGGRHAKRIERATTFEREMIRAGATDEDADYIRSRSRSFLESVLSSGGTVTEMSEDDLDEEFDAYLESNLRLQVEKRIKLRRRKGGSDR